METSEIKNLSLKQFNFEDMEKAKKVLEKNYLISYGKYEPEELKKAIKEKNPFYIKENFIIGFDPADGKFWNDENKKISIDRMVKGVIIEDVKEETEIETTDMFAIVGKNTWEDISEFMSIIGSLRIGKIFLPPHSAVFNFLKPTETQIKQKIVSVLEGININIYSKDGYVDNAIHEIGHIFWRICIKWDEKRKFEDHFKVLPPAAIYEYTWEKSDVEEMFCTIYKWYIKSILINPSFYNILEYEDPNGLKLLQDVLDRKAKDVMINDIWELNKDKVLEVLNPRFDRTTGAKIVKKGLLDEIRDVELPDELLNNVDSFRDGITYINLNKAKVPVKGNRIDWNKVK